jgi:hypothetical protein
MIQQIQIKFRYHQTPGHNRERRYESRTLPNQYLIRNRPSQQDYWYKGWDSW